MKKKITVIIASLVFAMFIISGGYGLWSETITVEGDIEVLPDPNEVEAMRQQLLSIMLEKQNEGLDESGDSINNEVPVEGENTNQIIENPAIPPADSTITEPADPTDKNQDNIDEPKPAEEPVNEEKDDEEQADDVTPAEEPDIEELEDQPTVETDSNLQGDN